MPALIATGTWIVGFLAGLLAIFSLFVASSAGEAEVRTAALVVAIASLLGVFGIINWAFDDAQRASATRSQKARLQRATGPTIDLVAGPGTGQFRPADARLVLSYFWTSFAAFAGAIPFGFWQMWARSSIPGPLANSANYYMSLTAHGVVEGYVMTTLFAMGFGYAVIATGLGRPVPARWLAWTALALVLIGTAMTALTIFAGHASVLYTFYPPMLAPPAFYLGLVLVFAGSWIWVGQMVWAMGAWKQANRGEPVPLAMFAMTAGALIWAWSSVGAAIEVVVQLLPLSLHVTSTIDIGLARTLFSWTLHGIVYFWLAPAYVAYYTLLPQAAGGRLYSDTMGRWSFIFLMVFGLPVGLHHLLMDPEHASAFKYIQSVFTAAVTIPTLLTIFTVVASLEIGGRLRGGNGMLGWVRTLPWHRPMLLAGVLSLLMLGLGGLGGVINMSYAMNAMVHNTAFIPAHFHLIFAGTTVIMYFAIGYTFWPALTGQRLASARLACWQLWLWFVGIFSLTLPWHVTGLIGMPRRMALFDYRTPMLSALSPLLDLSLFGGVLLLLSTGLFLFILVRTSLGVAGPSEDTIRYARALAPATAGLPRILNGFAVWNLAVGCLMLLAYGYPLLQVTMRPGSSIHVSTEEPSR